MKILRKNFQEISRILGLSIIIEAIFLLSIYSSIHFIGYSLEYLGILVIFYIYWHKNVFIIKN